MRGAWRALLVTVAFVMLCAGAASGAVIDFATGFGGEGGVITIGPNVTGTGIFIDSLTVTGAPTNNGVFNVDGPTVCGIATGGCGLLSFDRNATTISIVGTISGVASGLLLNGNLAGVTVDLDNGLLTVAGVGIPESALLSHLGLSPETSFKLFGTVHLVGPYPDGTFGGVSTDVANRAVPEPGSLALLGTGITAVAMSLRRRYGKKS